MCWSNKGHYQCYDCRRQFDHFNGFTPCYHYENRSACGMLIPRPEVIQTGQNCHDCKAACAAEEICQQKVYRQEPTVLFSRREHAKVWAATYEADLKARKEVERRRKAKIEAEKKRLAENPDAKPQVQPPQGEQIKKDEDSILAPPFVTMRHQAHA
ncbi:hypothetical protein F4810DRAFT_713057 [Camillea tinctor]|nr:hypothetical protein F4810DRAFT_713057 [Camillea tinctor]